MELYQQLLYKSTRRSFNPVNGKIYEIADEKLDNLKGYNERVFLHNAVRGGISKSLEGTTDENSELKPLAEEGSLGHNFALARTRARAAELRRIWTDLPLVLDGDRGTCYRVSH